MLALAPLRRCSRLQLALVLLLLPESAISQSPAAFIVLKGKHMGSDWFASQFNQLQGCALAFEFTPKAGWHLGSTNTSTEENSNALLEHLVRHPICHATESPAHACRAVGLSAELSDEVITSAMHRAASLAPHIPFVLHVRTNFVKHALSFLRTTCHATAGGARNHLAASASAMSKARAAAPLFIPPELLLARAILRHKETRHQIDAGRAMASGKFAYTLVYEAMQQDIAREIRNVLRAVGVPELSMPPVTLHPTTIKATPADPRRVLANFDAISRFFAHDTHAAELPCMREMFLASDATAFALDACDQQQSVRAPKVLSAMLASVHRQHAAMSMELALNHSECTGGA